MPLTLKFNLIFKKILAMSLIVSFFVPNISLAEDFSIDILIEEPVVAEEVVSAIAPEVSVVTDNQEVSEEVDLSPLAPESISESEDVLPVIQDVVLDEITEELVAETPKEVPEIFEYEISSDEIIVKFKSDSVDILNFAEEKDLIVTENFEEENISVVVSSEGDSINDTIENILENENVEYAEPNYERTFTAISVNDAEFASQWALQNTGQSILGTMGKDDADINVLEAWGISEGEKQEIIVAVIDTGVDYTHPDLQNRMWDGSNCKDENGILIAGGCTHGYDFVEGDAIPLPEEGTDYDFHGTHVAGIIASEKNNGVGVVGVAPNVKIMALRFNFNVSTAVQAIDFARENGAKIINASYSGTASSAAEIDAIKRFTDAGGIFITAAANAGRNNDDVSNTMHQFPSDYELDGIISVASTDQNDELSGFSNFGNKSVDVGAPGSKILSTGLDNDYFYLDGTSMSAPHAVGVASLIWGYNPELTSSQVKTILLGSGKNIRTLENKTVTGKRIDALGALSVFKPEILNFSFATTTEGLVKVNFNIRDGFAGLSAKLQGFEYSVDDGLAWVTPITGDLSASLDDNFKKVLITSTATSSDQTFVWNINHEDLSLKEKLLSPDAKNKFRFTLFDGATTSAIVSSSVFSIVSATTTIPVPEPTPEPEPPSGGGGGGGSGSGGGGGGGGSSGGSKEKKGDINSDNLIDILDFNTLMIGWGKKGETVSDINDDGIVDILDFNILMVNWK